MYVRTLNVCFNVCMHACMYVVYVCTHACMLCMRACTYACMYYNQVLLVVLCIVLCGCNKYNISQ